MEFAWKDGRHASVDAQEVGDAVSRIEAKQGVCAPGALVDEGRPDESPLHGLFEWDDWKAAENWRKTEARHAIASVVPIVGGRKIDVPAFVHVKVQVGDEVREGYKATLPVLQQPDLTAQVLEEAMTSLRAWRRRYQRLSEPLAPVFDAISAVDDAEHAEAS